MNTYYNILEGKTANFIGDSLFAAHTLGKEKSWIALLAQKYNMDVNNYGINGCTISACQDGSNPIIKRYVEMADNDPDFVVFEGGRNDFNKFAKIGEENDTDITTFRGALRGLIVGLREKYPTAVIIGVSFWNSLTVNKEGVHCNVYTEAMLQVCADMGVPCINAMDEEASGVRMTNREFREQNCMVPGDVCHLNEQGMKLALPFFERELSKILFESGK